MGDLVRMSRRSGERQALDEGPPARANELTTGRPPHPLDSKEARDELRQLLQWYYYERDRQAANRLEMAMDHDVYDGIQWSEEDKAILESRNQMALVYNETAPTIDWIVGTQRRAPVDWRVMPRTEDDVQAAEVKTKALKYVSDVNKITFHRSRAFADAAKGGLGWLDDGVRDDPTKEIIYSRYEDWRCVLHDSSALDLMGEDARYIFRWRWVDEDVALMMFPDRADVIRSEVEQFAYHVDPMDEEVDWQPGGDLEPQKRSGGMYPLSSSSMVVDAKRRRVRLIECQWRKPVPAKFVGSGPLRGTFFDPRDKALVQALTQHGGTIIDKIAMRVHVAVFTESAMLARGPSMYRHNQFSLTPVVCFRNGRTRQPYGFVRRIRDVQLDLNKRASKAQFMLNTNQIIGDEGAVDDWDEASEEAQNPQGKIVVKPGKRFDIRRDTDAATGQLQLMAMAARQIQKSGGVTDENLGRQTNATSGEAIKARQMQGAVVTTEIFDNLRLSIQTQGQKLLSLCEQFLTEERVIRLTGAQGRIEWVKINRPEMQPDGTVRYLDDITASVADFVVAEADYAGTLRQVMFESMNSLAQRLPPEIALRFLRIAFEYSDLPNKQEIVYELRNITGETDPNKEMTPEEAQAAEQQMRAQSELMQLQREQAMAALEEQRGKAREVNARAEKILAEIATMGQDSGSVDLRIEQAVAAVREQSAREIERLSQQLARANTDTTTAILKIRTDADTAAETARIKADSDQRIAEIQAANNRQLDGLMSRLEDLAGTVSDLTSELAESKRTIEKMEMAAAVAAPAPAPATAAPAPAPVVPAQPVTVVVQPASGEAKVSFEYGPDGKAKSAVLTRDDGSELRVSVDKKDGGKPDAT
jgi:hypothetical protein